MKLIIRFLGFLSRITEGLYYHVASREARKRSDETGKEYMEYARKEVMVNQDLYKDYSNGDYYFERPSGGDTVTVYDYRGYTVDFVDDPKG